MTGAGDRPPLPAPGRQVSLEIEKLVAGGRGLARLDGLAVFVDRGLPGQTVLARITTVRKRLAEAQVVQVLTPSPQQTAAPCLHFGPCGGCDWQDLDYAAQLDWKQRIVAETLRGVGRLELPPDAVEPVRPSPQQLGFRNKMEFAFSGGAGGLSLGLRRRNRPAEVLDVRSCLLMPQPAMDILAAVRDVCRGSGLPVYDHDAGRGVWRFCVLRRNAAGRFQALLLTNPDPRAKAVVAAMARQLQASFPALESVVHGTRADRLRLAAPKAVVAVHGRQHFEETLAGLSFRLSPGAFFQTNTPAAETLFALVREMAGLGGGEEVFDCYAGVGAMGLLLARDAGHVTGFEVAEQAVEDAVDNARRNGVANISFVAGDLAETLADQDLPRPDVVVLDPPRAGLDPAVAARLLDLAPRRMVAVSCDPATLARDLRALAPAYRPARICPVDLFPHSSHIETVVLLEQV